MIKKGKSYKCLPNGLLGTFTVGKIYTAPTDNHLRNDDGVSITICGESCVYDWSGYFTELEVNTGNIVNPELGLTAFVKKKDGTGHQNVFVEVGTVLKVGIPLNDNGAIN